MHIRFGAHARLERRTCTAATHEGTAFFSQQAKGILHWHSMEADEETLAMGLLGEQSIEA